MKPEGSEPGPCWVDGDFVEPDAAAPSPRDSAFAAGRGCYSTARYRAGRVRFAAEHAARLARDARRLGIGDPSPGRIASALEETARAAFGEGEAAIDGIVRIQASRGADGRVHLCAVPRHTGEEPAVWHACLAPFPHEGPMPWSGAKVTNHLLFALAGDHARACGVSEAILCDRDGYAIEGSRSNLLVVGEDGVPTTPDPSRGGVAGVGLAVLRARVPEIRERHLTRGDLLAARELLAVNAVRGLRPIVTLDRQPIGKGRPGPVSRRLQAAFDAA